MLTKINPLKRCALILSLGVCTPVAAQNWQHEVLFTHPSCPEQQVTSYRDPALADTYAGLIHLNGSTSVFDFDDLPLLYLEPGEGIPTMGGGKREIIPDGVFCRSDDKELSLRRAAGTAERQSDSPYLRVFDWLATVKPQDELFLASMSFSDNDLAKKLCTIAQQGTKVKLFIQEPRGFNSAYKTVVNCREADSEIAGGSTTVFVNEPEASLLEMIIYPRGKRRLAHMKTIVIKYQNQDHEPSLRSKVRYSFQSANLSSGMWAHHENWNFITSDAEHWLAKDHLCLKDSVNKSTVADLSRLYEAIADCRDENNINADRVLDNEIQNYFVPFSSTRGFNDKKALRKTLFEEVERSKKIRIAAHHLTDGKLLEQLSSKLRSGELELDIIVDDDMFWTAHYRSDDPLIDEGGRMYYEPTDYSKSCHWGKTADQASSCFGLFSAFEYQNIEAKLLKYGAQIRFFEANHRNFKLFHNKIIMFEYNAPYHGYHAAVFTGAGNLSKAGFERNFENYYLVRKPEFVADFEQNYQILFNKAVKQNELPITWDFFTTNK